LIEIINKQLLLQLVGYLCYWQMGFNSVFKGLRAVLILSYHLRLGLPSGILLQMFQHVFCHMPATFPTPHIFPRL